MNETSDEKGMQIEPSSRNQYDLFRDHVLEK